MIWKIFNLASPLIPWPYRQPLTPMSDSYLAVDTWCNDNIGVEGVQWRRFFMGTWEFKTEEDLIAFRLTWKYA